jgi:hypothetical protein
MKNILSVFVALLLTCSSVQGVAEEKEDFSRLIYLSPPIGHFDFERDSKFEMIMEDLSYWITHTFYDKGGRLIERPDLLNHFCAVGYKFPPNDDEENHFYVEKELVVYWKEKGEFRRWFGSDRSVVLPGYRYADYASDLMESPGFSMKETVSAEDLDVTVPIGSGHKIRERAENLVADCEKHGKNYIIGSGTPLPKRH